jgi:hypothetical protein
LYLDVVFPELKFGAHAKIRGFYRLFRGEAIDGLGENDK